LTLAGSLPVHPLVAVGSKNPAKTLGAKNVFLAFFPGSSFVEVDTRTVARAQPMGMDQVVEGALARAKFALAEGRADFGVGVEAGIIPVTTDESVNLQIAVVVDKKGHSGMGFSSGFVIPASFLEKMQKEGAELDRYSHELTRAEKITEEEGIVYHLTKGRTSRLQMTEQGVSMALIPWLNRETYGVDGF
jgi:inosine/xanthosine triphosphatase